MGCITPVGKTIDAIWDSMMVGASGIDWITYFDASKFPTKFASQVKDFNLGDYVSDTERFSAAGRNIHFAIGAATQAVADSGIDSLA